MSDLVFSLSPITIRLLDSIYKIFIVNSYLINYLGLESSNEASSNVAHC